jgi:hypothetical protein
MSDGSDEGRIDSFDGCEMMRPRERDAALSRFTGGDARCEMRDGRQATEGRYVIELIGSHWSTPTQKAEGVSNLG